MEFNVGDVVTVKPDEAESVAEDTGIELSVLGGRMTVFEVSNMPNDDYPYFVGVNADTAVWMAEKEIQLYVDVNAGIVFTEEEVESMLAANPYVLPVE